MSSVVGNDPGCRCQRPPTNGKRLFVSAVASLIRSLNTPGRSRFAVRGYYRWLGRTFMTMAVILPVGFTLIVLVIAGDPSIEHPATMANTLPPLLGAYAGSVVAFLIGRILARIPPGA